MKNKIIAVILCISVISSIFVISCFATIETLETDVTYDYVAPIITPPKNKLYSVIGIPVITCIELFESISNIPFIVFEIISIK